MKSEFLARRAWRKIRRIGYPRWKRRPILVTQFGAARVLRTSRPSQNGDFKNSPSEPLTQRFDPVCAGMEYPHFFGIYIGQSARKYLRVRCGEHESASVGYGLKSRGCARVTSELMAWRSGNGNGNGFGSREIPPLCLRRCGYRDREKYLRETVLFDCFERRLSVFSERQKRIVCCGIRGNLGSRFFWLLVELN